MSMLTPSPRSMGTAAKDGSWSESGSQMQGRVACCEGHRSCGVMPADPAAACRGCKVPDDVTQLAWKCNRRW